MMLCLWEGGEGEAEGGVTQRLTNILGEEGRAAGREGPRQVHVDGWVKGLLVGLRGGVFRHVSSNSLKFYLLYFFDT